MNCGIIIRKKDLWLGGRNYYFSLLSSLSINSNPRCKLFLYTDCEEFFKFNCSNIVVRDVNFLDYKSGLLGTAGAVTKKILGRNVFLENMLIKDGVSLLTHSDNGSSSAISSLVWMPDFQHKILPDLFSRQNKLDRDNFIEKAAISGNILVSSVSARKDFFDNYPHLSSTNVYVLPFVPSFPDIFDIPSIDQIREKYNLSSNYVFLPNQFWQHKNHEVVIDALNRCVSDVSVVCSGELFDHRNPSYVTALLDKAKALIDKRRFVTLGIIPYIDVVALMYYSKAVLNPSKFEGWSTTVEEAKILCKRLILSSIPVHLEQAPSLGRYFDLDSAEQLSNLLDDVHSEPDPPSISKYELKNRHSIIFQNFARRYEDVVLERLSRG